MADNGKNDQNCKIRQNDQIGLKGRNGQAEPKVQNSKIDQTDRTSQIAKNCHIRQNSLNGQTDQNEPT